MVSHNAEEDEVTTIARSPVILTSLLQSNMPSSKRHRSRISITDLIDQRAPVPHRSRISITDLIDQRAPVPVASTDLSSERQPSPSYYESSVHSSIVSARSGNVDDYAHDVCQQSLVGRQVKTSAIRHSSVSYGAPYRTARQVFPTTGSAKSESTFLSTARSRKAKTTNFYPLPSANCPIAGRETNAKVRDLDDRKNYYYGQQRYTFQQMSYTPREQTLSTQ
ncbi:hypothetical protein V1506DRAFT_517419 [Lipomyces tetrasporus]